MITACGDGFGLDSNKRRAKAKRSSTTQKGVWALTAVLGAPVGERGGGSRI